MTRHGASLADGRSALGTWRGLYGQHDAPSFYEFGTERDSQDFVENYLQRYSTRVVREPQFKSGLRPDLGFRVRHEDLSQIPLAVEVKNFRLTGISELVEAVRQAHSYACETGHVALVGPINARGPLQLSWNRSAIGAIGLVAAQFSVGYLYIADNLEGGIFIGGQAAVRFSADGELTTHRNARTLLTRKHFAGASTWRETA